MRGAVFALAVLVLGCPRVVRVRQVEPQLEAGVPVPFAAESDRTWDFGDGTPTQLGREVRHAFMRGGRYRVQAFEGATLTDAYDVFVVPRSVFHAVAPDAEAAIVARTLDELTPGVDFSERLAGASTTQRWLEALPVLGFALEQGAGGGESVVDRGEGLGIFTWPDSDVVVGFVGVTAEEAALTVFDGWLRANGWDQVEETEPRRYVHGQVYLAVFTDRGVLYALSRTDEEPPMSAALRIAKASAHGLDASPPVAAQLDALPAGGLVVFSRPGAAMPWSALTAAIQFSQDEARLTGRLWAKEPLWKTPAPTAARLLERVDDGVLAAASVSVPPERVATALFGSARSARRVRAGNAAKALGFDLEAAVRAASGEAEAAAWLDAPGFLRRVIVNEGRPEPRGTLKGEARVRSSGPIERLIDSATSRAELTVAREKAKDGVHWRTRWFDQPVDLRLDARALTLTAGAPLEGRTPVDLVKRLSERLPGAFGPGHVSLFLDLGQARREMMVPRLIEGLDPREVVSAQARTLFFLDTVTHLEDLLLDIAPDAQGATVQVLVRLKPKVIERR